MSIRFSCPSCRAEMQAADTEAGKAASCVQCRRPVTIPAAPTPARPKRRNPLAVELVWFAALLVAAFALVAAVVSLTSASPNANAVTQIRDLAGSATVTVGAYCVARAVERLFGRNG
jgi:hypothetical protein